MIVINHSASVLCDLTDNAQPMYSSGDNPADRGNLPC